MGTSALEHASQKFAFSVWGIDPQSEHERYQPDSGKGLKHMPDLLVSDLDPAIYERRRKAAADRGKSLAQMARDLLAEKLQPSKAEVWATADRLRKKIAKVSGNSTADIGEWRDNVDSHR
jgi:hypothetical protein